MCNEYYVETISANDMMDWLDGNMLEIIHRENFTTITISTERGPRSFRTTGHDSLYTCIQRARQYQINGNTEKLVVE